MKKISMNKWCKQCGICAVVCPKKVFDFTDGGRPFPARVDDCVGCKICVFRCPDFAITVEEAD